MQELRNLTLIIIAHCSTLSSCHSSLPPFAPHSLLFSIPSSILFSISFPIPVAHNIPYPFSSLFPFSIPFFLPLSRCYNRIILRWCALNNQAIYLSISHCPIPHTLPLPSFFSSSTLPLSDPLPFHHLSLFHSTPPIPSQSLSHTSYIITYYNENLNSRAYTVSYVNI